MLSSVCFSLCISARPTAVAAAAAAIESSIFFFSFFFIFFYFSCVYCVWCVSSELCCRRSRCRRCVPWLVLCNGKFTHNHTQTQMQRESRFSQMLLCSMGYFVHASQRYNLVVPRRIRTICIYVKLILFPKAEWMVAICCVCPFKSFESVENGTKKFVSTKNCEISLVNNELNIPWHSKWRNGETMMETIANVNVSKQIVDRTLISSLRFCAVNLESQISEL